MCRAWLGGVSVFVDEPVASGGSDGSKVGWVRMGRSHGGQWWLLVEGAVGSVLVVAADVIDDEPFELALVPDDGPIKELSADRSDPASAKRAGYRSPVRGLEGPEAFGAEALVEGVDESCPGAELGPVRW